MAKTNKTYHVYLMLLTLITSFNGTLVDSGSKDKRPDVNFYGKVEDHYKTFEAVDILIGGKYEVIPVYQTVKLKKKATKEEKDAIDPKQNKAIIDLHEVKSIELKHPEHPTSSEIEINNRKYIEIIVTSINGTKKIYLIESTRKVTCKEVDKGPQGDQKTMFEERELNMIHVKKLKIKGYKSTQDIPERKYHEPKPSVMHEEKEEPQIVSEKTKPVKEQKEVTEKTENILNQLEQQVKDLPREDASTFEKMKTSILSLLKSLREQIQKMLNMLS